MMKTARAWLALATLLTGLGLTSACARDCGPFVAARCAAAEAEEPGCQRLRQIVAQVPLQTCEAVRNALDSKSRVR
jgi:hypothetical protein